MAESRQPEGADLSLQFFGSALDDGVLREAGEHFANLLREVTGACCGDESAVEWRVGALRYICDGCDVERPTAALPLGWINVRGRDYCPQCVLGGQRAS